MKKQNVLIMALALAFSGCSVSKTSSDKDALAEATNRYLENVNVDYGYNLAVKMEEIRSNKSLGYRTAGSKAELETGDMLKSEMEKIGLENVTKDEFTLDGWEFDHAVMKYRDADNSENEIDLGGYQTTFVTDGFESFELVDGGQGTKEDLKDKDVNGKFVLVDINQRDNWWINYPAYEAKLHGAAGIIAAQNGGYGEVSDDALNAQDVCGPEDAVALSISQKDAEKLRNLMTDGKMNVQLDVNSQVTRDTSSYNIVGTIPGKSDDMVLMSAHYDSYFSGFQDDNAAIALMMSIAKAVDDSGYKPEKTLVFCAMASEEWGMSDTRYDWSTGAYNEIFRVHPEWVGKVIADINFELPAMSEGDTDQIRSSYELKTFLDEFVKTVPQVEGVFEKGTEVIVPTQTWSDDFSLSIAGVPSTVTALRGGFARSNYHSQFDDRETYSKEAFRFHHNLYGMLLLAYDQLAVSPLDFSIRFNALKEVTDNTVLSDDQVKEITEKADEVISLSEKVYAEVQENNEAYRKALNEGEVKKAEQIYNENKQLNSQLLTTFKLCEDQFVRLTWEDVSEFPHEHSVNNLVNLNGALLALKSGKGSEALDEYLYQVDNNWYAYDFSKETYEHFTDYVIDAPADRLMWGAGRVQGHNDLYDVISSIKSKEDGCDYSEEIAVLEQCIDSEKELLEKSVLEECEGMDAVKDALNAMLKA